MHYLAGGGFDLQLKKSKIKSRYHQAGEKVTCIAKIKNIGENTSAETVIVFYLTDDGKLSTASTVVKLGNKKVPAIKASKKIKIKYKVMLPLSLKDGDYFAHAIVDPENTSGDDNISNNSKSGNKIKIE
jgi:hypothetical protein